MCFLLCHLFVFDITKKKQHSMPRSQEVPEQMRYKVIDIYQSRRGYKVISTALWLQQAPVRAIIHKREKLDKKRTQSLLSHLPKNILIIPRLLRRYSQKNEELKVFGLERQKLYFLEDRCPLTSGLKIKPHFINEHHTNSQA